MHSWKCAYSHTLGNYIVHYGPFTFKNYLYGDMICRKQDIFSLLGYWRRNENSWEHLPGRQGSLQELVQPRSMRPSSSNKGHLWKENRVPHFQLTSLESQAGPLTRLPRKLGHKLARTSLPSRHQLCDPMDCSAPTLLPTGFPRQEYWSGWPFPSLGDLLDPGMEPMPPESPAL